MVLEKKCINNCKKLSVFDWAKDIPEIKDKFSNIIEVQFKNTRKSFFINNENIDIKENDFVVVEAKMGYDLGIVVLTGPLIYLQIRKKHPKMIQNIKKINLLKVLRKATDLDIKNWEQAKEKELSTMKKAREIVKKMKIEMKISDVEFQADNKKAIFYYIADERVDFRQLIKVFASEFRSRVEMKQIGSRQEASMVGGIAPCGRELCCSSWISNFNSVSTSAARQQNLSLNPEKITGLCNKLKCCLNYEADTYKSILKEFPSRKIILKTEKGDLKQKKYDTLKKIIWYSLITDDKKQQNQELIPIKINDVKKIIEINKKGEKIKEIPRYDD